ncbi:hypothetical protein LUZ61_013836 [Rhynchospora tenuis]|uniref:Aminotransferase-like plant mobile domain-containing protein n=1 Tax=Rhynchospora tenuis TaxID=198213 RepID=A0AAD5W9K6_9POAL|nr:hypothetical protein LUZ61_013836 [Rhynchospora tenuis]
MSFQYSPQIEPILSGFGLNNMALLGRIKIDWALITALVERWRRETHTFHLPTGEIAPTLQDVCCLLGLENDGEALMGDIDENYAYLFEEVFGEVEWETFHRPSGTYHLRTEFFVKLFVPPVEGEDDEIVENYRNKKRLEASLPENSPPEEVKKYAICFMLDLFGSVMFPNKSGYLYSHFLPLIHAVENPRKFSWGSGLLAYLYRGLCKGAEEKTKSFAFCAVFLQIWAWTRFPIGRPEPNMVPEEYEALPLGSRWVGGHDYGDVPHGSVSAYRLAFEELRDDHINWDAYNLEELPEFCQSENEKELWFYDGPLIWFYIVEAHPIQRVMRLLKKRQAIPPPLLSCPDILHESENIPFKRVNWMTTHAEWLTIWNARRQHVVRNNEAFSNADLRRYMAWFNANGMRTVFWQSSTVEQINMPQPAVVGTDPLERRFVPRGERVQQNVIRNITIAHDAVAAMREFTGRARAFARRVLLACRGNLNDVNREDIFDQFRANHEVTDEELMVPVDERTTLNPVDFRWVQDTFGGNYGDHLPEGFVFQTQPQ